MIILLFTVALGTLFAIFATQNTGSVDLNFGSYFIPNIPIYLLVLIPLLFGIMIAFLFHALRTLSYDLTENEQKREIKKLREEVTDLTKRDHKLELENVKLKKEKGKFDEDSIL